MNVNIIDQIKARKQQDMEYGYHQVYDYNRPVLLGPSTRRKVDALLLDFLNLDQQAGIGVMSESMGYAERSKGKVRPLLSGLAKTALTGPVAKVRYIDMQAGIASDDATEYLGDRLASLYDTESSASLFQLVLVNGGVSLEDEDTARSNRAKVVIDSLSNLSPEIFRVGMIAVPEFIDAVGSQEGPSGESVRSRVYVPERSVALVS